MIEDIPDKHGWQEVETKRSKRQRKTRFMSHSCCTSCSTCPSPATKEIGSLSIANDSMDAVEVQMHGKWEALPRGITIDSGAAESVLPPDYAQQFPTEESEGSRAGLNYISAGGGKLPNMGEKQITFMTNEGQGMRMKFQVAPVTKPLGSVKRIVEQGNRVVFSETEEGSYIEHCATGQRTALTERNGVYVLDAWMLAQPFGRQGR